MDGESQLPRMLSRASDIWYMCGTVAGPFPTIYDAFAMWQGEEANPGDQRWWRAMTWQRTECHPTCITMPGDCKSISLIPPFNCILIHHAFPDSLISNPTQWRERACVCVGLHVSLHMGTCMLSDYFLCMSAGIIWYVQSFYIRTCMLTPCTTNLLVFVNKDLLLLVHAMWVHMGLLRGMLASSHVGVCVLLLDDIHHMACGFVGVCMLPLDDIHRTLGTA